MSPLSALLTALLTALSCQQLSLVFSYVVHCNIISDGSVKLMSAKFRECPVVMTLSVRSRLLRLYVNSA